MRKLLRRWLGIDETDRVVAELTRRQLQIDRPGFSAINYRGVPLQIDRPGFSAINYRGVPLHIEESAPPDQFMSLGTITLNGEVKNVADLIKKGYNGKVT